MINEILIKDINDLPLHDSELLEVNISQDKNGDIRLNLEVVFCEGEFENLSEYSSIISKSGRTIISFNDCEKLDIHMYGKVAQRDLIDNIKLERIGSESRKDGTNRYNVFIKLISGSNIKVIAEMALLGQVI